MLFILGKAISGAPIIIGTNQFPNPPIKIGITMKKIIKKSMGCYNNVIQLIISMKDLVSGTSKFHTH